MKKLGMCGLILLASCSNEPTVVEPDMTRGTDERDMFDTVMDMSLRDVVSLVDSDGTDATTDIGAPGDGGVYPHWVLRDRNGDAVEAWASPAYRTVAVTDYPPTLSLPPSSTPICFSVSQNGGTEWIGSYSLATGTLAEECLPTAAYGFDDPGCTRPVWAFAGGNPRAFVFSHEGVPRYTAQRLSTDAEIFNRDANGNCTMITTAGANPGLVYYSSEPVPATYAEAFADGAPYTISVEY